MSTLEGVTQHINQLNNTTMNNPIKYCIGLLVAVMLTACSTSTISNKVNLNLYEYASIVNHIPTELVEYELELFEAIETSRLEMIGEHRINDLTPQQQSKLLLVKFGVNQYDDNFCCRNAVIALRQADGVDRPAHRDSTGHGPEPARFMIPDVSVS